jgi:hypothetical protein
VTYVLVAPFQRDEGENLGVLPEYSRNHVSEVLQEVETIGNLHGVRDSQGMTRLSPNGEERRSKAYALHDHVPRPHREGQRAHAGGEVPPNLSTIMEELQPEAAYFTDVEDARGTYFVVNMDDGSELPAKVEPLFHGMGAEIQVHLAMTPEDMQKAIPIVEQAAQKYG